MRGRGFRSGLLIGLGICLFCAGAVLGGYNLWDMQRAEQTAMTAAARLAEVVPTPVVPEKVNLEAVGREVEVPDHQLNPKMDMPVEQIGGRDYIGMLTIPALGLELPVGSEAGDSALRDAPCRYTGSAYLGNMVIAGHNYRQHFGRLPQIALGDTVTFADVDGNLFYYRVADVEKLQPTQIEEMCSSPWDLTLFTCTSGRQGRFAIRCEAVE